MRLGPALFSVSATRQGRIVSGRKTLRAEMARPAGIGIVHCRAGLAVRGYSGLGFRWPGGLTPYSHVLYWRSKKLQEAVVETVRGLVGV